MTGEPRRFTPDFDVNEIQRVLAADLFSVHTSCTRAWEYIEWRFGGTRAQANQRVRRALIAHLAPSAFCYNEPLRSGDRYDVFAFCDDEDNLYVGVRLQDDGNGTLVNCISFHPLERRIETLAKAIFAPNVEGWPLPPRNRGTR